MLLAIDIGNTNTVIGIFDNKGDNTKAGAVSISGHSIFPEISFGENTRVQGLISAFRISTLAPRTADELAIVFTNILEFIQIDVYSGKDIITNGIIDAISVASSVPQALSDMLVMLRRLFDVPIVVADYSVAGDMNICYQPPQDVGPDRIVDALAAKDLYGTPAIVVDLGTATTFDVISPQGDYLGGAIIPGLVISQNALAAKAAALRNVELKAPSKAIGTSTMESIQSGLIFGHVAMIEGMCAKIEKELGAEANLVITGGLAQVVVNDLGRKFIHEPWLTLYGLKLVYDKSHTRK